MKRITKYTLLILLLSLGLIACSEDNSSKPSEDFNNLTIPDDFNWTNLEYLNLNISLDNQDIEEKTLVTVRHNSKVLLSKFIIDGSLQTSINSVKGYQTLIVDVPAYNYSKEISTTIKNHNLTVPTSAKNRFSYESNIDPYFANVLDDNTSDFLTINDISPWMIQSFIDNNNIYIPTEVPPANTGWHKLKFNLTGTGSIERRAEGINNYLLLGTDWVIMQTIDVENFDYFNENLEGAKTESTVDLNQCPYNSYLTNTYIFLDENMNYLSFYPWPPWSYTDTDRFFSDRENNNLNNAKYVVIVGQYNGNQGNVRLNNWLVTLYDTDVSNGDSDGDGVANNQDLEAGNPNIAGKISVPGGFMMFEDLWPDKGDYDFNDLYIFISDSDFMVNADNKIVYFDLYFKVLKAGASLHNGLGLRFLNSETDGTTTTYTSFDQGNMLNSVIAYSLPTNWSNGQSNGDWSTMTYIDNFASNTAVLIHDIGEMNLTQGDNISLRIYFDPSQEQPENPIPDFFLFRSTDRSLEVHLPGYPPTEYANMDNFGTGNDASLLFPGNWYKTEDNYPWALYFSNDSWVPAVKENIPIFRAYPDFSGWVTSAGQNNQDWINNYDSSLTENPWSD